MKLSDFQNFYRLNRIIWSAHGLARMQERDTPTTDKFEADLKTRRK